MTIYLAEIDQPHELTNGELRILASQSTKSRLTKWYRILRDDEELAFLAIDRWPDKRLVPYAVYVLRALRGRGIGSAVLQEVERLAQEEGFEIVRVLPRPLDETFDQADLER